MTKRLSLGVPVLAPALLAFGLATVAQAAETKGPVTDDLGVVEIPEGAPIVIGGYWTLSGPDTALGLDEKRAVEVAFDEIGNELLDHPIQFIAEDSQCNAEGGQAAATKLASIPNIVAVLGPDCSSSATPGAPILWNAGIVDRRLRCNAHVIAGDAARTRELGSTHVRPALDGFVPCIRSLT